MPDGSYKNLCCLAGTIQRGRMMVLPLKPRHWARVERWLRSLDEARVERRFRRVGSKTSSMKTHKGLDKSLAVTSRLIYATCASIDVITSSSLSKSNCLQIHRLCAKRVARVSKFNTCKSSHTNDTIQGSSRL
jgi:hypothetical protein